MRLAGIMGLMLVAGACPAFGTDGIVKICESAQYLTESLDVAEDSNFALNTTVYTNFDDFIDSKPRVKNNLLEMGAYYSPATDNHLSQIWCKYKTQTVIADKFRNVEYDSIQSCGSMNQLLIDQQIAVLSEAQRLQYQNSPLKIVIEEDQTYGRGDQWTRSQVELSAVDGGVGVSASSLRSADWVPFVGGMRYCKLLSPESISELLQDAITKSQPITQSTSFEHQEVQIGKNLTDIFLPIQSEGPLPAAVFMQGGKVDKQYYRRLGELMASQGVLVAIPNHNSFYGKNMTQQVVMNNVWEGLNELVTEEDSILFGKEINSEFFVMGHSLGGVAALRNISDKCSLPTCAGRYDRPEQLAGAVVFGTSTRTPIIGTFAEVKAEDRPIMYIQGDRDGVSELKHGYKTFAEKTEGNNLAFVTLQGANHFSVCDVNNPEGADPDKTAPTLDREAGLVSIATWASQFIRANLMGAEDAIEFVYGGSGDALDELVTVETRLKQ